jgi:zinc/manganese transport system permease protein
VASADLAILLPAFLCGLLVLSTHVPLGQLVLERGIVFIDLAIAQVAGLGVVAADAMGWEPNGWSVQVSAVVAALLAATFLIWSERRLAAVQEAVIGVVFVVAASAEIILLSSNPHGAEHLKDLLVGQILWVEPGQLIPVLVLYAVVLAAAMLLDLRRRRVTFYAFFAVTITASVQLVGVFLVFASLIVPALAARAAAPRRRLLAGYAVGFAGYVLGLLASAIYDFPTGAAIVCLLAATGAFAAVVLDRSNRLSGEAIVASAREEPRRESSPDNLRGLGGKNVPGPR